MRIPRFLAFMVAVALILTGCSKARPPAAPPKRDVDWWMANLTLEEKVGQLFWFGLPGPTLAPATEQMIREGKVGGLIFFARQGSDPAALKGLTDKAQAAIRGRERPLPGLFVSVDQEGGQVQRWGPPFTAWPGNMAIGATRSEAYAEQVAAAIAKEMLAAGVNMNLAPVADVNNNPANPVIGVRSFGEEPDLVARLVAASVKGYQSQHVSSVAKHFPGHGDTDVDSHKALPLVKHPWERLDKVELVPFRSAMSAGVDAVMTAHVIFPEVATDGLPATLSPKVLQGLLREKMGFKGLVVTDAMDVMKAISDNYGVDKGLVMAIQAGADVVLVTESYPLQPAYYGIVLKAVQDGQISQARLNDAVRRNLVLKEKRGLLPESPAATAPAAPAVPALDVAGWEAHRKLAAQVGADALTLVRSKDLPLRLKPDDAILALGPSYGAQATNVPNVFTALGAGLKEHHANVQEITLDRKPGSGSLSAAKAAAAKASVIVYGVYNGHRYPEHQALINEFLASGKTVIVVGMGEPYDLTAIPGIQNYVAAYSFQTPNLQGVGALLFGKAQLKGKLPVSIPGLYPAGHGLSY